MNDREKGRLAFEDIQRGKDVSSIAFVAMAQAEMLDDVTITENQDQFVNWDQDMALPALKRGLIVSCEGILYRLLMDLNDTTQNGKPPYSPSIWGRIGNPEEEYPEWVPWIGGMDLYMLNAKVTHKDWHWISTVDNNVWEPGVYGWEQVKFE